MPRQEWGGIEPMEKIFLLTFLFIGLADFPYYLVRPQLPLFSSQRNPKVKAYTVRPDSRYIKRPKKMALATLPQAEQIACFLHHCARIAASPFPILSGNR